MATHVYIDGFNFYRGCVRGTDYKWLDLQQFCDRLLPDDDVRLVRYFTAMVSARKNDPDGPLRQQIYLRALRTLPRVQIHMGVFVTHTTRMPVSRPKPGTPRTIEVIKTEEKETDVALGAHLLMDVVRGACDTVVVISNDSDLVEPLRIARDELSVTVGVFNPHIGKASVRLGQHADFHKDIPVRFLGQCQLPPTINDAKGLIYKPKVW